MAEIHLVVPKKLLIIGATGVRRMFVEQQKLGEHFPQFGLYKKNDDQLYARGTLRTSTGSNYPVQVILPADYPHSIPHIFAVGWDSSSSPHVYKSGNLCIMKPEQWRPFYSIAFVVARTAMWCNKFDVFRAKGYWPGNEQPH